jgi:hypothetical protein
MAVFAESGMTADTFGFLLVLALLLAVLKGIFFHSIKKTKKRIDDGWYDPTYYHHT